MIRATLFYFLLAATLRVRDVDRLLYSAAAANDRAKFEAVLENAISSVETMPLGEARNRLRRAIIVATDLDRVWRYDALYWDEESLPDYYDRLAGEYPDFERFIVQFRLVDQNRRVLYPKQETRQFLLEHLRPVNSRKRGT